jgi:hypothetical protein
MIYIASPYTSPQPGIVNFRVAETRRYCAWLFSQHGLHPYSPIVHWHDICTAHDLPTDAHSWIAANRSALRRCDGVHVLQLPGWQESAGVTLELEWARAIGLPLMAARVERHSFHLAPLADCG